MVKSIDTSNLSYSVSPNYLKLLSFLIEPLLDSPDSLKIDCEEIPSTKRVWIRLAVDEGDKGRIYGRGGRNIQSIQNVLAIAAKQVEQTLYLEVYEESEDNSGRSSYNRRSESNRKFVRRRSRSQSPSDPKLSIRSRWQENPTNPS
ncbi:KH domain-containing protein [Crocosphaera watsonii WH 8501]|uniref:KH domain RNA binding protein YlqC n=6 Tax=Crocosphaera watsonii TaxID=263511 RepID=T2JNZ8_CROWT|nr:MULTISPECIES: KH domain-containing protein [Crocosphaera]EHJ14732.1 KH domain RNA binding protein YlqC [Crocosphaera watsonii WH 0003]MCH2245153.1 KH domain-containing protein [Crocosphaera sp.]NQZ62328.1 KH domain-containing protein [Crocosphaera sp.]CCQ55527.1 KH domain RNA binding protein YlqC [Crocosphaera watsonii WH 0005]CCQ63932.1 KH domain RNA binding protein YlqC [Crocosphaera watsonii WH 0401]